MEFIGCLRNLKFFAVRNNGGISMKPEQIYRAKETCLIGKIRLEENVNIWYHATIRADEDSITIGKGTNIQDNAVLHVDRDCPMVIGNYVTVGHGAILHGCTIGENTVIGMGAIVLNNAVIGKNCIIGAGAVITQGKEIPDGSVVLGNPGKVVRNITDEEMEHNYKGAIEYIENAKKMFGTETKKHSAIFL